MKTKKLIELLSEYPEDMNVNIVASYKDDCNCKEYGYCYCSYEDHYLVINGISDQTEYDKKTKKQKIIGICIRGD